MAKELSAIFTRRVEKDKSQYVHTRSSTQNIDHLGLVAETMEQLDMGARIEKGLPTQSKQKILTRADGISAMILNVLGSPTVDSI